MSTTTPWFARPDGLFGPDYLRQYEGLLTHDRTTTEVDFIEKVLQLQPGTRILDVPCGHGRHTVELARRGCTVTGLDLNRFFLDEAQKAADRAGVSPQFEEGDMRELEYEACFDVALNLFTSMGYFQTDEDDRTFLSRVYRSLRPGGRFLIDFMNRNWVIRNFRRKDWMKLPDGSILLIERVFDDVRGRNLEWRTKITEGEVSDTQQLTVRLYTTNELVALAESVGFTLVETFGDFAGSPLSVESRRLILHCAKE